MNSWDDFWRSLDTMAERLIGPKLNSIGWKLTKCGPGSWIAEKNHKPGARRFAVRESLHPIDLVYQIEQYEERLKREKLK